MIEIKTKAVGVTKGGRQKLLARLIDEDSDLFVDRDPDNEYDPDAIGVYVEDGDREHHLGFLKRELAAKLAPMMDAGHAITVLDHELTGGGDDLSFGLNLTLGVCEEPNEQHAKTADGGQVAQTVGFVFAAIVVAAVIYGAWWVYGFLGEIFGL